MDSENIHQVQVELQRREPIFHRPEFGTTRADFERMMADDFWEIGASGKCYTREFVLQVLEERHSTPQKEDWQTSNFRCRQLSDSIYLLTYTLTQNNRVTQRSTIWRRAGSDWKIVFHQGTIVAEP